MEMKANSEDGCQLNANKEGKCIECTNGNILKGDLTCTNLTCEESNQTFLNAHECTKCGEGCDKCN